VNFSKLVNISDEALVMLVVSGYFPRWALGVEDNDDDENAGGGVGKRQCGAVKGEKNTGTRTIDVFRGYAAKCQKAQSSQYAALWDERLKEQAIDQHVQELMEKEKVREQDEENDSPVVNSGFDMDLNDGCFDGDMENSDTLSQVTPSEI
jgi:hypothetical protein